MKHILMIGVDDPRLQALTPHLEEIHIHRALNTPGALDQVRRQDRLALLITPAQAQDIDGFQIVLAAREYAPEARVIILTDQPAATMPLISEHCIAHYVDAEVDTDDLLHLVRATLDDLTDLAGRLDDLELMDITVLACLTRRSAVLHIHHNTDKGQIVFHEGDIAHASFRELRGADALFELLALQQGDIFMQNRAEEFERTITLPWHELLLGGFLEIEARRLALAHLQRGAAEPLHQDAITDHDVAALLGLEDYHDPQSEPESPEPNFFSSDELREFEEVEEAPHFPPTTSSPRIPIPEPSRELLLERPPAPAPTRPRYAPAAPAPAPRQAPRQAPPAIPLHDILERLQVEIPEFLATQIIHTVDGLPLASLHSLDGLDDEGCAAFYSDFFNASLRAVHGYGLSPQLEDTLITTQQHYLLLRALPSSPFLHLVLMGRQGNLGIAKVLMRQFESQLLQALPNPEPR
jgi:hypothetical protein